MGGSGRRYCSNGHVTEPCPCKMVVCLSTRTNSFCVFCCCPGYLFIIKLNDLNLTLLEVCMGVTRSSNLETLTATGFYTMFLKRKHSCFATTIILCAKTLCLSHFQLIHCRRTVLIQKKKYLVRIGTDKFHNLTFH